MFGYLKARTELLDEEQLRRYQAAYCGLCRSLKERHGQFSRLTLTYDMTFLALLLDSLYEPERQSGEEPCLVHPFSPRAWQRSEYSDYAADMTVALAYLKCLDDWDDDSNPAALAEAAALKKAYRRVQALYPRQCRAMEEGVKALRKLELKRDESPDAAAECFAALMGEVFILRQDRWSGTLYRFGAALGRMIYILDACMDLDSDTLYNRYNPFRRYYGLDNTRRFRDILRMLLSDCARELDRLPLVQDAGILQNIICVGLWTEFEKKYGSEDEAAHGTGSV